MTPTELDRLVAAAVARRADAGLPDADTDAFRLIHDTHDGLPGVMVDRFAGVDVLRLREPRWWHDGAHALVDALAAHGARGVYVLVDEPRKHDVREREALEARLNEGVAARGLAAPADPFVIRESGRRYEVSVHQGFSQGLFLDMRGPRRDLAERWRGRRVANLFAYTCGFGVALSPDADVVNVDVSASYLEQGRRNYALNDLPVDDAAFVKRDAFEYLDFAVRRGIRWDAIVLDPPAYSRGKKGRARAFSLRTDLGDLVGLALDALADDGELFVSTNLASLAPAAFDRLAAARADARGRAVVQSWPPPPDFPAPAAEFHLKTALIA